MYKKKLGVRVITAITVGALLSSNMSVAMANTQIATLEDNLDEKTADEEKNVEEEETETVDETVEETETEETEEEESTDEIEESDSEKEVTGDEEDTVETEEEETPVEEKREEETDKEEEAPAETDDPSGASDDAEELPAEETEEETDTAEEGVTEENTDAEEEVPAEEETVSEEENKKTEEEVASEEEKNEQNETTNEEKISETVEASEPVEGVIWIIIKDENDTLVGSSNMYDISEIDTNEDGQLTEDELSGLYDSDKYEFVAVSDSTITPGNTYVVTVKEKEEPAPVEGVIWIIIKDENDTLVGSSNMYDISEIDTNEDGQLTEDELSGLYDSDKYEFVAVSDSTITPGNTYVVTVKEKEEPEQKTVTIDYYVLSYDESTGELYHSSVGIGEMQVAADATSVEAANVPALEGYEIVSVGTLEFNENGTVSVQVRKVEPEVPDTDIIMNIQFYEGDEYTEDNVIGGGDYFVPAGVQNYSVLDKYVPVGYKIAESGDFFAEEGAKLKVRVEKVQSTIINVVFTDAQGNNVGGGDYFVDEDGDGIFNYSELDVPEGYKLVETGDAFVSDFVGKTTELKVVRDGAAIINVTFTDAQGNNVGGGDYFVDEDGDGIFNYSELDVPEGYKLVVTGDAFVNDFVGKTTELKVVRDGAAIINAQFVDEDGNVIAGGDYFVDEDGDGIFNYSELAEYVPEGYTMQTLGDAFVAEGTFIINISKDNEEPETKNVTITYVDENGKIVGTQTIEVPAGDNNINTSKLTVPEGFELVWTGDLAIEDGAVTVEVKATENPDNPDNPDPEDPDNPDNPDPEDPDNPDNPDNPDPDQPDNPNQGGSGSGSSGGSSGGSGGGSGSATGSHALRSGEWILDDIGWWYQYSDNTYAKAGWYSLVWRGNTDWYYFNEAGYLISGWFEQNGNRYFLHDVHDGTFGRMYTGWNQVEGQWYFFNDNADNGTVGALVEGAQVPAELLNQ